MDKLYEVADFYLKNLMSRKFHLTVGKSNNLLEFDIIFGAEDFKYLFGKTYLIKKTATAIAVAVNLFKN